MTNDRIDRTLVEPAAQEAHGSHRGIYLTATAFIAALIVAAWVLFSQHTQLTAQSDQLTAQNNRLGELERAEQDTLRTANALADQIRKLGAVPVVTPPPLATATDPGDLRNAARTAVDEYCAARNGCRGPDGVTPNVDTIVDMVLARVPTPQAGRDGRDAPTPDWAAQVAAYCGQTSDPCRGKPGTDGQNGHDGAPGVSVVRQYFDRASDGQCHNFNDFSDGRTRVDQGPAGDSACPAPSSPPPTQTTPAVLPPGVTRKRRD